MGEFFATRPDVAEIIAKGPTKVSVRLQNGVQCDLRLVSEKEYPYALHHFTGSKEHHIALRSRALDLFGWSINDYRFSIAPEAEKKGKFAPLPEIHDETEFYHALGMDYVPPELRENLGEIDAAAAHRLPELVALENLRGTFHCHTNASDGHNTLEEMAGAARDLGIAVPRHRRPQQEFLPGQRPGRGAAAGAGGSHPEAQRAIPGGRRRGVPGVRRGGMRFAQGRVRWISPTRCWRRSTTWW